MKKETVIYDKTVYRTIASLAKENLTKRGYFDIEKIPNLRVVDSGFIKDLRENHKITQKELSRLVGVPLRTLIGWESYKKSIPIEMLMKLSKTLGIEKDDMLEIIDGCEFTFGSHHGKNRIAMTVYPDKFEFARYIVPQSNGKCYVIKDSPNSLKKRVIEEFPIDKYNVEKTGLITINSYMLNKYIRTFYKYETILKLRFPLSDYVQEWASSGRDLVNSVIIPILLSDGGEKPNNRLFCSGQSDVIHRIWSDALYFHFKSLPSSYKVPVKGKTIFVTTHNVDDEIMKKLRKLCPSFKTSPYKQDKKDYLRKNKPTISTILSADSIEQQIAIRIWFSAEGSIGIHLDKKTGLVTPRLKLACAHPKLTDELSNLLYRNKIHMSKIYENKNWAGISGLSSSSIKSSINFLRIGGFIRGVEISRKSRYNYGLDKQELLLSIFEFMDRQRHNSKLRLYDTKKIKKEIRGIALNNEFKTKDKYLRIFGD